MSMPIYTILNEVQQALYRVTINSFSLFVIFLGIIPRIWLPLEAAIPRCSETFILAFIVTPKSFSFTVLHMIVPHIKCEDLSYVMG